MTLEGLRVPTPRCSGLERRGTVMQRTRRGGLWRTSWERFEVRIVLSQLSQAGPTFDTSTAGFNSVMVVRDEFSARSLLTGAVLIVQAVDVFV